MNSLRTPPFRVSCHRRRATRGGAGALGAEIEEAAGSGFAHLGERKPRPSPRSGL